MAGKNARERLLALLKDGKWHEHLELRSVAGTRYSARLLELRRLGWVVEDRNLHPHGKAYRMTSQKPAPRRKSKRVKVFLTEEQVCEILSVGNVMPGAERELRRALASFQANRDKL